MGRGVDPGNPGWRWKAGDRFRDQDHGVFAVLPLKIDLTASRNRMQGIFASAFHFNLPIAAPPAGGGDSFNLLPGPGGRQGCFFSIDSFGIVLSPAWFLSFDSSEVVSPGRAKYLKPDEEGARGTV
jgi:hypothetical protein